MREFMTNDEDNNVVPFSQKMRHTDKFVKRISIKPHNFQGEDNIIGSIDYTTSTYEMGKDICHAFGVKESLGNAIGIALRMARAVAFELHEDPNTQVIFLRSDGTEYTLDLDSLFPGKKVQNAKRRC